MKKKHLLLSQIKVKSFITELEIAKSTTAKGGGRHINSDGDPTCEIDNPTPTNFCPSKPDPCVTTPYKLCRR